MRVRHEGVSRLGRRLGGLLFSLAKPRLYGMFKLWKNIFSIVMVLAAATPAQPAQG